MVLNYEMWLNRKITHPQEKGLIHFVPFLRYQLDISMKKKKSAGIYKSSSNIQGRSHAKDKNEGATQADDGCFINEESPLETVFRESALKIDSSKVTAIVYR